jgi:hypothetical protein
MAWKKGRAHVAQDKVAVVDNDTGEVLGKVLDDEAGALIWVPPKHRFGREFIVLFQGDLLRLAQSDLTGSDLRVFLVLLSECAYENRCELTYKQIGELIGMRYQHVYRSIKKLVELGYVERSENIHYLSAACAWKGRIDAYHRRRMIGAPQSRIRAV